MNRTLWAIDGSLLGSRFASIIVTEAAAFYTMRAAVSKSRLTVTMAGQLADKPSPEVLMMAGLGVDAVVFAAYAEINELATATMMVTFIAIRQMAQGVIRASNNLTALRALPEDQVMMAADLLGLLRRIAAALNTSMAGVF